MKVKELIDKLAKMNLEAQVFIYSNLDEGDAHAMFVQECGTPPYCQGDSVIQEYIENHPGERVVIIHNDIWIAEKHDFYYKTQACAWEEAAKMCEEVFGVHVNWEDRFFICPECDEPIYEDDWSKFEFCPICEFEWFEFDEEEL